MGGGGGVASASPNKLIHVKKPCSIGVKAFENDDTINELFTNQVTLSVIENTKPSLSCTALASSERTETPGFTFPCSERVAQIVNQVHLKHP